MSADIDPPFPFTPVVIVGAARSGTNALRDMLTALPSCASWPCDEINPIWRHGNLLRPDDELPEEAARPTVRRFVRRAFLRIWQRRGRPDFVIEKTCANTLRLPFVARILPEARYIHIKRSQPAVVASAARRWRGELEMRGLPYFLAKARYTPLTDLPVHAVRALGGRALVALGLSRRLPVWGPRCRGLERHAGAPLEEVCAWQHDRCVALAEAGLARLDPERILTLAYEDMRRAPEACLSRILAFLETGAAPADRARAAALIRPDGAVQTLPGSASMHESGA